MLTWHIPALGATPNDPNTGQSSSAHDLAVSIMRTDLHFALAQVQDLAAWARERASEARADGFLTEAMHAEQEAAKHDATAGDVQDMLDLIAERVQLIRQIARVGDRYMGGPEAESAERARFVARRPGSTPTSRGPTRTGGLTDRPASGAGPDSSGSARRRAISSGFQHR